MCRIKNIPTVFLLACTIIFLQCTKSDQASPDTTITEQEMVLIPAGEFTMGKDGEDDCSPVRKIYIDSFYLDKYEVTNARFYEFCQANERQLPEYWGMEEFHSGPDFPDHPVVGISWFEARAYAEWAGKRLPTEAEWEYAARGGLIDKKFPFGDEADSSMANMAFGGVAKGTVPVGSYPPNGYGLHDMAGNVVEWVADFYDKDYYSAVPDSNPPGPENGKFRSIRGGGWHSGPSCNIVYFRSALRPGWRDINVGFRCAKDVK